MHSCFTATAPAPPPPDGEARQNECPSQALKLNFKLNFNFTLNFNLKFNFTLYFNFKYNLFARCNPRSPLRSFSPCGVDRARKSSRRNDPRRIDRRGRAHLGRRVFLYLSLYFCVPPRRFGEECAVKTCYAG